jgi:hypothetical protein
MSQSNPKPPFFLDLPNHTYQCKLRRNGDKESPHFRPFCIGKASDIVPAHGLYHVSFQIILMNITIFMGMLNSMRML